MEIMTAVASGIGLGFLYLLNKEWELGYIARDPAKDSSETLETARKFREHGSLFSRMAARASESNYRELIRPETPLSKSLKQYWDRLDNPENSLIDKLVLEATEFPTFRGIYRSLDSAAPTI